MARPSALQMLLAATGSVRPPALLQAGFPELDLGRGGFPAGSELVELEVTPGCPLRGAFVPADPGAPVVLHFLESEGSVTFGARDLFGYRLLQELQDLGFASLMVDYRGIGASAGKRSPGNVPGDAWCAWQEALRRAGGDARRVVLRGMSFGCLTVACLLEAGAAPGAVILVAPPRAETVVRNWMRRYYPKTLAQLATALVRAPLPVDIVHELGRLRAPLLVYAPADDYVLPAEERSLMQRAVAQAGGAWVPSPLSHPSCVLDAHQVFGAERPFLAGLFPGLPPGRSRLEAVLSSLPERVARLFPWGSRLHEALVEVTAHWLLAPPALGAALAGAAVRGAAPAPLVAWLRRLPHDSLHPLPYAALDALLDFQDAAGELEPDKILELSEYLEQHAAAPIRDAARLVELELDLGLTGSVTPVNGHGGWRVIRAGCSRDQQRRRQLRALLKAAGLPERQRFDGGLEYWQGGTWRELVLAPAAQPPSSSE